KGQGHGQSNGGDHIHPEDLGRGDGQHPAKKYGQDNNQPLGQVGGQDEHNGFDDVVVNTPPLRHGFGDGGEVVVGEHKVGGFFGRFRALAAHGHTYVGAAQGRGVVNTVAGHGRGVAHGLERLYQLEFVGG